MSKDKERYFGLGVGQRPCPILHNKIRDAHKVLFVIGHYSNEWLKGSVESQQKALKHRRHRAHCRDPNHAPEPAVHYLLY